MPVKHQPKGTIKNSKNISGQFAPGATADQQSLQPKTRKKRTRRQIVVGRNRKNEKAFSCMITMGENNKWEPPVTTYTHNVFRLALSEPDGTSAEINAYAASAAVQMLNNGEIDPNDKAAINNIVLGAHMASMNFGVRDPNLFPLVVHQAEKDYYAVRARAVQLVHEQYFKAFKNYEAAFQHGVAFNTHNQGLRRCNPMIFAPDMIMGSALSITPGHGTPQYLGENGKIVEEYFKHKGGDGYTILTRPVCCNPSHECSEETMNTRSHNAEETRCSLYGYNVSHLVAASLIPEGANDWAIANNMLNKTEVKQLIEKRLDMAEYEPQQWRGYSNPLASRERWHYYELGSHKMVVNLLERVEEALLEINQGSPKNEARAKEFLEAAQTALEEARYYKKTVESEIAQYQKEQQNKEEGTESEYE